MIEKHLKNVQSPYSSEKCKPKQTWGSTSHQSEWLRSKSQVTADAGEDVEKEEHSSIAGGIASWYNHSRSQSGSSSAKLDIVLPEDPAIPHLGIYPEDAPTGYKDTCSTMFIAALFIIARGWKELRCPSTFEWIQKKCGAFTQWSTTQLLKNEFMKFLGKWMDVEGIILSEVTQSQRNSHNMYSLISGY